MARPFAYPLASLKISALMQVTEQNPDQFGAIQANPLREHSIVSTNGRIGAPQHSDSNARISG
jgi:hypothetical protein